MFDVPVQALTQPVLSKAKASKMLERGCDYCTLNKVRGVRKIMGRVRGRSIALFVQSPGPDENDEGKELVGPAGQFLWDELRRVGIKRPDCDIQSVVRCLPATWQSGRQDDYLQMRNPTAGEIHCCSVYTDVALEQLQATQILIFGQVAAKAVLRTRSLPKAKAFWSPEHKAKIYLLDHPSFFIRGYGKGPRYDAFRALLDQVAADRVKLDGGATAEVSDPYWYVRNQNYLTITTGREAREAVIDIRAKAGKRRVSVDIEDDDGTIRCIGICPKPGLTYVFILKHHDVSEKACAAIRKALLPLLADPAVEKVLQFGCTDADKMTREQLIPEGLGASWGYTHDTYFSEFLRFSDLKAYGLDEIVQRRFPQFGNYWTIIAEEMLVGVPDVPAKITSGTAAEKYKYVGDNKLFHIGKLSLATLTMYNGADCDVTKRAEAQNRKKIPQALMALYIDLGYLLHHMEPLGPLFDYEQHQQLDMIYPVKAKALSRAIRKTLRRETNWYKRHKKFNPGSPDQIKEALYSRKTGLGLEYPFAGDRKQGKPNTRKMTMLMLGREHKFPGLVLEWRKVSKVKSTYLDAYVRCAKENQDRLRTKWKATGARTGRLSSGGDVKKKGKTAKLINLQNIKKDAQMQNMCVADRRWRQVYKQIDVCLKANGPDVLEYWDTCAKGERRALKLGEKWKAPDMSRLARRQYDRVARLVEKWLRKHIPDFKTFIIADYGQVEVRAAAQLSGDKRLMRDCAESDIHTTVGATMTGWDAEAISKDELIRTLTKNVHFGILFGIAKNNLFNFVLSMTPPEVRKAIYRRFRKEHPDREPEEVWRQQVEDSYDRYFRRYKGILRYITAQRDFAREHHFVTTAFGMIQTLNVTDDSQQDEVIDPDEMGSRSAYWGNQAVNGPVQGTAHQLMICALVNLLRRASFYSILGIPPLEVHDALYFAINVLDLRAAAAKTRYLLEQESLNTVKSDFPEIDWKVPIAVDMKAGVRLGTKVSVDENTEPGDFLLQWFAVCRKQMVALDAELLACAA